MDVEEHAMKFLPIIYRSRGTCFHKSRVITSMYKKLCLVIVIHIKGHDESARESVGISNTTFVFLKIL